MTSRVARVDELSLTEPCCCVFLALACGAFVAALGKVASRCQFSEISYS